jgi:hypothetical protein
MQRNGEALRSEVSALTMQIDNRAGDTAAIKSALTIRGRAFNLPQQDVWRLRGGLTGGSIGSKLTLSLLLREARWLRPQE